ncbi:peptidylprolyl isomerase [Christiangramia sabulilitoris]|uniref:Peptidyl-prolyl cis-trans isomerase n=1 Tax=Christiangramia sabulilitoris TaxID=2583991 RepID=A0A550I6X5_9FLAO|nr:peptidylprolyl isomerase [Christiangramia sabulilitoris]TRO66723.1 peptidylprolyl isomerase [Christiangramia sabulilitoris]
MFKQLSLIAIFSILFFASCEDKQTSSKNGGELSKEALKAQQKKDSIQRARDSIFELRKRELASKDKVTKIEKNEMFPITQEELIPTLTQYGKENQETRIRIKTKFGNIDVQLFRDTPLHRANFIMLAKNEYFNHTFFHRVAPGFVIQGGNADNQITASSRGDVGNYLIPSEFEAGHKHTYGAFSAAKYAEQNVSKASSPFEFFIVMDKTGTPHLNNDHTVYGKVISGMDVAERIAQVETGASEWPVNNVEIDIEVLD